jgi:hypothetical protein
MLLSLICLILLFLIPCSLYIHLCFLFLIFLFFLVLSLFLILVSFLLLSLLSHHVTILVLYIFLCLYPYILSYLFSPFLIFPSFFPSPFSSFLLSPFLLLWSYNGVLRPPPSLYSTKKRREAEDGVRARNEFCPYRGLRQRKCVEKFCSIAPHSVNYPTHISDHHKIPSKSQFSYNNLATLQEKTYKILVYIANIS